MQFLPSSHSNTHRVMPPKLWVSTAFLGLCYTGPMWMTFALQPLAEASANFSRG